jgi:hypothetical protein
MKAKLLSETTVDFQWTTQRYIPEDRPLHNHWCDNLKPLYRYMLCRVQNISDNASPSDSDAGPYVTITMGNKIATPEIQLNTQGREASSVRWPAQGVMQNILPAAVTRIRLSVCPLVSVEIWTLLYTVTKRSTENTTKNKLRGLSPQANYTDRATAACRRS